MYGLVHRALQCFSQDTYGDVVWNKVVAEAGVQVHEYEAMLFYPDHHLDDVLLALSNHLDKTPAQVSEDVGAYLVTHQRMEAVRRLLRFGGATFEEFVLSLDELHDRVKLALPELDLPELEVEAHSGSSFSVLVKSEHHRFGAVLLGILRAMADDFGTLVMLDLGRSTQGSDDVERATIELFETDFATGRGFGLVAEESGR
ncbi:heme-NO-binding protein [Litoreibacter halocynthiae]|uniref:Heme-NO-binding protein n=1 Tax=Litoreibacter halocynthiae TaxID=1242689 RepID=A0A4R7LPW8_9RHOB|nr:heme NO-binding domain-containing protein [Litoreibacter halocynthiae]TDT76936.1 heme-NO-binding protein [Litoreibacter halocynthiae]